MDRQTGMGRLPLKFLLEQGFSYIPLYRLPGTLICEQLRQEKDRLQAYNTETCWNWWADRSRHSPVDLLFTFSVSLLPTNCKHACLPADSRRQAWTFGLPYLTA